MGVVHTEERFDTALYSAEEKTRIATLLLEHGEKAVHRPKDHARPLGPTPVRFVPAGNAVHDVRAVTNVYDLTGLFPLARQPSAFRR
ncbi:hypothetical protein [Nonomuraea rubra]|uniref:hypothetical protein n=1 Tax=Nonomuraea rubra TaxID=46180 RepID=UPI0033D25DD9